MRSALRYPGGPQSCRKSSAVAAVSEPQCGRAARPRQPLQPDLRRRPADSARAGRDLRSGRSTRGVGRARAAGRLCVARDGDGAPGAVASGDQRTWGDQSPLRPRLRPGAARVSRTRRCRLQSSWSRRPRTLPVASARSLGHIRALAATSPWWRATRARGGLPLRARVGIRRRCGSRAGRRRLQPAPQPHAARARLRPGCSGRARVV